MSSLRAARRPEEPVRAPLAELRPPPTSLLRKVGRVRVPLSLGHRPWATAYRMPNGRTIWCLRLRQGNRIVRTVVSTETLRRYARLSGLAELLAAVEAAASPEAA